MKLLVVPARRRIVRLIDRINHFTECRVHQSRIIAALAFLSHSRFLIGEIVLFWEHQIVKMKATESICNFVVFSFDVDDLEGLELLHVQSPSGNLCART